MKMYNKALLALVAIFAATPAFADEASSVAHAVGSNVGLIGIGVGIMMGFAVLGGTLGQSKAAATALEGIARNPAASDKLIVPLILSLALIESLVLFAFLISFQLEGSLAKVLEIVK